jgi:dehydrogenase/reductase SDR family protein 4
LFFSIRIDFAMAQRFAVDGAHVVTSSLNRNNVDEALAKLKCEGLSASGMMFVTPVSRKIEL